MNKCTSIREHGHIHILWQYVREVILGHNTAPLRARVHTEYWRENLHFANATD